MEAELDCIQVNREIHPDSVGRLVQFADLVAESLSITRDEYTPVVFSARPVINLFSAVGSLATEINENDSERILEAAGVSDEDAGDLEITNLLRPWGWDLQLPGNKFNMNNKKPAIEIKDRYVGLPFKDRPTKIAQLKLWEAIDGAMGYARNSSRISRPTANMLRNRSFRAMPLIAIKGKARDRVTSRNLIEVRDDLIRLMPKIEVGPIRVDFFKRGQEIKVDFGKVR